MNFTRRAYVGLLSSLLAAFPLAASAGEVWVAPATEKIRPDAKPRDVTEARLEAARNEFEAFQVVVHGPARHVSARASALEGAGGRIAEPHLFRVDMLSLRSPSAVDGGTGRWPDALVPDVDDVVGEQRNAFPFDVPAGESRAIWVEVHVPAGAGAGVYGGDVKVTTAEGEATVPVSLQVYDLTLPSTSSLRTAFNMSYGGIPAGHRQSGDAAAATRARYGQLGLDHRITLTGLNDDGMHPDLDHLERFYGPLLDGQAKTQLDGAKLTAFKYVGGRTDVNEHKRWAAHARQNGWFDVLFDYTCDEPPLTCRWDEIGPRTRAAHDADRNFRTLVTTQIWDAQDHGVANDIDIMVPLMNWMDDKQGEPNAGSQRKRYDGWLDSGKTKELWLYQSCMSHGCGGTVNIGNPSDSDKYFTGWPSYMVDASAGRNRSMEWVSFLYGATGELYWEVTFAFAHDAWSNQWDFSGNGDGTLFYPGTPARIGGKTDIPVASQRLKMIREGMEDYEYLKALSDAGDPELARKIAKDLFPQNYVTDVSADAFATARRQIATRVAQLTGKATPDQVAAGSGGVGGAAGAGGGCSSGGRGVDAGVLAALPALLLLGAARRRAAVKAVAARR